MQKKFILKWVPRVAHINPLAFVIVCCFIALIGGVLFYSITSVPTLKQNTSEVSTSVDPEEDKRWYQNESDVIQQRSTTRPAPISVDLRSENTLSDQTQAELKAAMSSPLKASMNDVSSIETKIETNIDAPEHVSSVPSIHHTTSLEEENVLHKLADPTDEDSLHQSLKKPVSPFILQAGTLLPATLINGISSELPGQLTAMVNQNVYDSIQGRYLLIPQGAKLILIYDAQVAYGQKRLLVSVKRIIFPNGASLNLQSMPAVDTQGQTGFHDQVNHHYSPILGSAAMLGLMTGGLQLSQPAQTSSAAIPSTTHTLENALSEQVGQVAIGMMNKNLNVVPELLIRPGYLFNVEVTQDLIFPGAY